MKRPKAPEQRNLIGIDILPLPVPEKDEEVGIDILPLPRVPNARLAWLLTRAGQGSFWDRYVWPWQRRRRTRKKAHVKYPAEYECR